MSGEAFKDGKKVELDTVRKAVDCGIAYATEDRKTAGLNLIGDIKENITIAGIKKLSPNWIIDRDQIGRAHV